jgi:hypothetical protein
MSFQLRLALARDGPPNIACVPDSRPTVAIDGCFEVKEWRTIP